MRAVKGVVIFRGFQNRVKRHVVCVVQKVSNMENPGQTHNIDLLLAKNKHARSTVNKFPSQVD